MKTAFIIAIAAGAVSAAKLSGPVDDLILKGIDKVADDAVSEMEKTLFEVIKSEHESGDGRHEKALGGMREACIVLFGTAQGCTYGMD